MLDIHPSSFRDHAGFIFTEDGIYKRAVRFEGREDFELLLSSGLYASLLDNAWILPHSEAVRTDGSSPDVYKVLIPDQLDYITYPYEWSFDQLKDAAILTLQIQAEALKHGMSLKDASAFNIQFRGPRPIFIDTLSFESNRDSAWVAYGQFCRHFLAPLLLMSEISLDWNRSLRAWLEGIPLDLASRSLPLRTWLRPGPLFHIHLHSRVWKRYALGKRAPLPGARFKGSDRKLAVIDSLLALVERSKPAETETSWSRYYREAGHYPAETEEVKKRTVTSVVESIRAQRVLDLGGNIGTYGRVVTRMGVDCICIDFDALCVNMNYLLSRDSGDIHMLPLVMDITDPSPALGFDSSERLGLLDRPKPDLTLALGILHHLRISGNIPTARIAQFLSRISKWLLIEYVPREDDKSRQLLEGRECTYDDYSLPCFLDSFGRFFEREWGVDLPGTLRSLHLFRRRP